MQSRSCKEVIPSCITTTIKVDSYEKLVFTLCKSCAETRNQNKCKHTDTQRSFIGTWTTDEVSKALEKGYKILRIYEVWHFAKSTDTLFKGYIRRFMKIKLESSSYNFKTKEEEDSFKARIKDSLDIDVEKFEFNAGLRSIAKLCLNSLWGKFGQRNNMSQTKYVTDVSEFYEILLDDKLGNKNFQFINDDMVQMTYNFKDQFVDNSNNTNIYIACFTTSHARLMLYDKLDYLNEKVLYFDTDSIIYADDNTKNIETGDMLGDMTDEISGKGISSFISTGPKSYSFKYGDDKQKSAIKGFTLNHENNNLLNHDSLSKIVKRQIREITIVNENKITRKNREIVNKYCEKIFKFGYDKRVIKHVDENHIDALPYMTNVIYDKRDDFDFHIVNFPFLSSNIPSGPSYGVYILQLIRYARCCSHYDDFRYRHKCLVDRLQSQGYKALRLEKSFKKFYGRYQDLIEKYRRSVNAMVSDSFPGQFLLNM